MFLRNSKTCAAIDAVNHLGWDMVAQLCAGGVPSDGTAISALSIAISIAMLAGGAEGVARRELCTKLCLQTPTDITTILPKVLEALTGSDAIRFKSANALFADKTTTVYSNYIQYLRRLDATIKSDFPRLAEGVDQINDWVSRGTDGLITDMLTRDNLEQSHMVLINALVFQAAWEEPFDPKNTIRNFPLPPREPDE